MDLAAALVDIINDSALWYFPAAKLPTPHGYRRCEAHLRHIHAAFGPGKTGLCVVRFHNSRAAG